MKIDNLIGKLATGAIIYSKGLDYVLMHSGIDNMVAKIEKPGDEPRELKMEYIHYIHDDISKEDLQRDDWMAVTTADMFSDETGELEKMVLDTLIGFSEQLDAITDKCIEIGKKKNNNLYRLMVTNLTSNLSRVIGTTGALIIHTGVDNEKVKNAYDAHFEEKKKKKSEE